MKCHNCKTELDKHDKEGCDNFQLDVISHTSAWHELTAYLKEAAEDWGPITASEILAYMQELTRMPRHRKALVMKVEITPAVIAEAIQAHYNENPDHGYNCFCMDRLISMWRNAVQRGKPSGETALRAFRYVLVQGERDW